MKEIESLYLINRKSDFKLTSASDLKKIHAISHDDIEGYCSLSQDHRDVYEYFVVKFYNSFGIETRCNIVPVRISHIHGANYIRFDYTNNGTPEWVHIVNEGRSWY